MSRYCLALQVLSALTAYYLVHQDKLPSKTDFISFQWRNKRILISHTHLSNGLKTKNHVKKKKSVRKQIGIKYIQHFSSAQTTMKPSENVLAKSHQPGTDLSTQVKVAQLCRGSLTGTVSPMEMWPVWHTNIMCLLTPTTIREYKKLQGK